MVPVLIGGRAAMHQPYKLIWLSHDALRLVAEFAVIFSPRETGGVLLGYRAAAGTELVVTHVVGPGPYARHTTRTFFPDLEYQHREIARFHEASGGLHTYLGDWHSHPSGGYSLSRKDKRTMLRVAFSSAARTPRPAMLIAAGAKSDWTAMAWQIVRAGRFRRVFGPLPIATFDA